MDNLTDEIFHPVTGLEAEEEQIAFPESVCHRTIRGDTSYYPQAVFHGRIIYFCTETCKSVFMSDPERFYSAHSKWRSG
jgi:YHS domain-containing protein